MMASFPFGKSHRLQVLFFFRALISSLQLAAIPLCLRESKFPRCFLIHPRSKCQHCRPRLRNLNISRRKACSTTWILYWFLFNVNSWECIGVVFRTVELVFWEVVTNGIFRDSMVNPCIFFTAFIHGKPQFGVRSFYLELRFVKFNVSSIVHFSILRASKLVSVCDVSDH